MFVAILLLFLSSFLSATVLPGNSEIALGVFIAKWPTAWVVAFIVASVGNTMGGMTSWWLGRFIDSSKVKPKIIIQIQRFGIWLLLFSWVPIIGDALCVAAGWMRTAILPTIIFLLVGKAIRYLLVIYAVHSIYL